MCLRIDLDGRARVCLSARVGDGEVAIIACPIVTHYGLELSVETQFPCYYNISSKWRPRQRSYHDYNYTLWRESDLQVNVFEQTVDLMRNGTSVVCWIFSFCPPDCLF